MPTTGSSHTSISKPEGTSTTEILATYAADDPEDDTLTWTLSGADATDFTITRNSNGEGVLRFQHLTDFESPSDTANDTYHTFLDDIEVVSVDKVVRTSRLVFNTAWLLANDDDRPPPPR